MWPTLMAKPSDGCVHIHERRKNVNNMSEIQDVGTFWTSCLASKEILFTALYSEC